MSEPGRLACAEAEAVLVLGQETPGARARVEAHLSRCPVCQRLRARLAETREVVEASAPPLDDMRRARILARLAPAIDELAAGSARAGRPFDRVTSVAVGALARWRVWGALALVGVATVLLAPRAMKRARPGVAHLAGRAEGDRQAGLPLPLALAPFQISGAAAASPPLGTAVDRLELPAGQTVSARLGAQARVTLVGPARLRVVRQTAALIEARLDYGALAADYDHTLGGRLRVLSPGAVTEVIGTLFTVAVEQGRSRVGVARGRVYVEANGTRRVIEAGAAWTAGAAAAGPIDGATRGLIEAHERAIASQPGRTASGNGAGASEAAVETARAGDVDPASPSAAAERGARAASAPGASDAEGAQRESRLDSTPAAARGAVLAGPAETTHRTRTTALLEPPRPRAVRSALKQAPDPSAIAPDDRGALSSPATPPSVRAQPAAHAVSGVLALGSAAAGPSIEGPPAGGSASARGVGAPLAVASAAAPSAGSPALAPGIPTTEPTAAPPALPARSAVVPAAPAMAPAAPASPPSSVSALSAEALYRAAEGDMRRRDWPAAAQRLERLVTAGTHSALEDVARYELAQLALRAGDRAGAARRLDELLASDREASLREPAQFLRCEIKAQDRDRPGARGCLARFRDEHPGSVHDAAALGWLIRLATEGESCGVGRALVSEYLRRYPAGADAAEARRREARCAR